MTAWESLTAYPPYYVRLLAKRGRNQALSDAEIAIASGIEINRVREIKCMTDWSKVLVAELLGFTLACGFDPTSGRDRNRVKDYEKKCQQRNHVPFQYLRKSPKWASEILPVLQILQRRISSAA